MALVPIYCLYGAGQCRIRPPRPPVLALAKTVTCEGPQRWYGFPERLSEKWPFTNTGFSAVPARRQHLLPGSRELRRRFDPGIRLRPSPKAPSKPVWLPCAYAFRRRPESTAFHKPPTNGWRAKNCIVCRRQVRDNCRRRRHLARRGRERLGAYCRPGRKSGRSQTNPSRSSQLCNAALKSGPSACSTNRDFDITRHSIVSTS